MTHDVVAALAVLGVVGQVFVAVGIIAAMLGLFGVRAPLKGIRRLLWGYELWAAFVVAALATGGSLIIFEVGGYQPCELCWFEMICMYPLSILLLLFAWQGEVWRTRYLVPFPLAGIGVSVYHLLIQSGAITESVPCRFNPIGVVHGTGCSTKWFNEFGYMTITVLALTAFLLLIGLFALAVWRSREAEGAWAATP